MAVSIADVQKLRKLTGAGLADCKKALDETGGDIEKAIEIIRAKGQAIAAKRSDRETSNGCVLVKVENGFGAIIALKCETDFVANGKDYVQLTQDILDAAVAAKAKNLDEVKALTLADGTKVEDAVIARSGITGEKMELDGYSFIEGENIYTYNHMSKNLLCTMAQTTKPAAEEGHAVTMQIAAMKPIATVPKALKTIDTSTGEPAKAHHQRSDVCAVPAAGVVAEAMVALVLAQAALEKFGGDSIGETRRNMDSYLAEIPESLAWASNVAGWDS